MPAMRVGQICNYGPKVAGAAHSCGVSKNRKKKLFLAKYSIGKDRGLCFFVLSWTVQCVTSLLLKQVPELPAFIFDR